MGRGYSEDLRKQALLYLEAGHKGKETSEVFGVSRKVLYDWKLLVNRTGKLEGGKSTGRPTKLKDPAELRRIVENHCDKKCSEIAKMLGLNVTSSTISRWINKIGFSFKKNVWASGSK